MMLVQPISRRNQRSRVNTLDQVVNSIIKPGPKKKKNKKNKDSGPAKATSVTPETICQSLDTQSSNVVLVENQHAAEVNPILRDEVETAVCATTEAAGAVSEVVEIVEPTKDDDEAQEAEDHAVAGTRTSMTLVAVGPKHEGQNLHKVVEKLVRQVVFPLRRPERLKLVQGLSCLSPPLPPPSLSVCGLRCRSCSNMSVCLSLCLPRCSPCIYIRYFDSKGQ